MKLVIQTQYKENYGAHDWDGQGTCPEYWKFKGGSTYVVPNLPEFWLDVGDGTQVWAEAHAEYQDLLDLITYSNEAQQEYVLDITVESDCQRVVESWDSFYECSRNQDGSWACLKEVDNTKDGWRKKEIHHILESWIMGPENDRANYTVTYRMEDGNLCNGSGQLNDWFEAAA